MNVQLMRLPRMGIVCGLLIASMLSACLGGTGSGTAASNTNSNNVSISATATTTAQSLTVGTAMSRFYPITPSGGATPYKYSVTSGTLPAGLSLDANTGAVTGTPTAPYATANVVFSVQDANAVVANTTSTVIFTVGAASPVIIATANTATQSLTVGTAMASFSPLTPSGGAAPYTYSIAAGTLPAGLSLDASTGAVTGTPSAAYAAANVVFSVKDANNVVASTTSTVIFIVGAASATITATANTTAQNLVVGTAIASFSPLTPSGGVAPYTYSYLGTLPAGLSLDSGTGAVTGIPSASNAGVDVYFLVRDANRVMADTTSKVRFSVAPAYSIGGTVSGLSGSLVLQDNGGDNLTLSANGSFTFSKLVQDTQTYAVTILTQPAVQACSVTSGAGAVSGGNISNVSVTCSTNAYTVGGSISGLNGSVTLQNNAGDNITLTANGTFTFPGSVTYNTPYAVTVLTPPTGQNCSIANGSGTMGLANVGNVNITCSVSTHTVGGNVTGLNGSIVLQNNGADNLSIAVNGPFSFPTALNYGSAYSVSLLTQPGSNRHCNLYNGSGILTGNVSNIGVACADNLFSGGIQTGAVLSLAGNVSTLAGTGVTSGYADGTGATALFNFPGAITTDGTTLYVADTGNHVIRKIDPVTGTVTTIAGTPGVFGYLDGIGTAAKFRFPGGITTDGTNLYVADTNIQRIRKVVIATGEVTTVAGSGTSGFIEGTIATACFNYPEGVLLLGSNLYVADTRNHVIRKVDLAAGMVSTLAGIGGTSGWADGPATTATFNYPTDLTTPDGINLYVADSNNHVIRKVVIATGEVSTVAGTPQGSGYVDGTGAGVKLNIPHSLTTDGYNLYVADSSNNVIRKIVLATGAVSTLAGTSWVAGAGYLDGPSATARFKNPYGIISDGTSLYVMDHDNHVVRQIK